MGNRLLGNSLPSEIMQDDRGWFVRSWIPGGRRVDSPAYPTKERLIEVLRDRARIMAEARGKA